MLQEKTIHELIEAQARRTPGSTAIVFNELSFSYEELVERASELAAHLVARGVEKEDLVGLCMHRSADMLVAAVAILKSGAAYVPIDPTYPENRIRHMIEDSGTRLVVTESSVDFSAFQDGIETVLVDGDWSRDEDRSQLPSIEPGNLAYTIYTSGSTGKPKGVQVTHGNVVNFLGSMQHTPGLVPEDRLLAVTTLSFDIAVLELYLPLITGATVEIASTELAANGPELSSRLSKGGVSIMQATPATWRMLLQSGWGRTQGFRALIGGEALPRDLLPGLLANVDELWNMYGPTETTVWSTCYRITQDDGPIYIGTPIDNTDIHIVGGDGKLSEDGEPGELLIGGLGVTRGYFNRPELNAERYVADTFGPDDKAKLYKTGDLVKRHPDGNIEYLNRIDNQVKLRGFRIELGEIEAVVARHSAVGQCVTVLRNDPGGEPRLVSYVTSQGDRTTTVGELRSFVQRDLPEYMTPSAWVFVDTIPLTPNGKVDRNALPEPGLDRPELGQAYVPPRSALEKYLAKTWREALGLDRVGTRDRFFDLGGNSIKAIQFVDQLGNRIGEKIAMPGFFAAPCIADFAKLLEKEHSSAVSRLLGRDAPDPDSDSTVPEQSASTRHARRHTGEHEDLAIIGIATRLPGAGDTARFWENLQNGIESRHKVTEQDLVEAGIDPSVLKDPDYVPYCMPLDDVDKFDAAFFGVHPREAQLMDPQHRIFLECSWTALEDAGYPPADVDCRVGVFGGVARNAYHLHNISAHNDMRNSAGDYHILLGNDKDFLATRVAFKLNLRGPAMTILTACSGSGTALHQARLSLLAGDCDMALVGGGRIMSPQKVGYHYVDGNVLSADGRVHAFDEKASGMIRGSGMVVIAIKRLSDAVRDGDYIRAVIKSTSINNDGASKASFTAPSVGGQVDAVIAAMDEAGVSPDQISYVEAHGTGTRLGDPIEVAALTQAYAGRTRGNQYCPIGSSKTNIGHLDAGACVTGIIKTALSLEHESIPPSLNFEKPNPLIDFQNSPFHVNTELTPWPRTSEPRRAAVSSFGVGGTNVHVVMEEAPEREPSSPSRPRQLLLLSAKRSQAINVEAKQLADYLKANVAVSLPDVAYTLQAGRSQLQLRHGLVVNDRDDAIAKLDKLAGQNVSSRPAEEGIPVAFMFPGQGSQHVNMARELYDTEAVFRVHVQHCARALKPLMGIDLLETLYPDSEADQGDLAEQLTRTEIAQLALFVVEYSLAKLWLSWGVKPSSMIGHSVGEFVAACLSGVIELHDCLKILVSRASLMGSMPPGDMLAVAIPAELLDEHLIEGVVLAASNAPDVSVVSGKSDAIANFREIVEAKDIQTFPLHTSHAFHSEMMEPVLEPFIQAFEGIALSPPSIPFVSSRTGTWVTAEQATSPDYWAQQLRNPVLFSQGIMAILDEDNPVFLEIGPGTALSNSVRKHNAPDRQLKIVTTLSAAHKPEPALETALKALSQLWAAGVEPDWKSFYASEIRHRLPLPTYPFEKARHWLEPPLGWNDDAIPEFTKATETVQLNAREPKPDVSIQKDDSAKLDHPARIRSRLREMLLSVTGVQVEESEDQSTFLEIGFDSLLLTQISARLRKEFGVLLKFQELIEDYSSVDTLSGYLAEKVEPEAPPQSAMEASVQDSSFDAPTDTPQHTDPSSPHYAKDEVAHLKDLLEKQAQLIQGLASQMQAMAKPGSDSLDNDVAADREGHIGSSGPDGERTDHYWRTDSPPLPGARLGRDPQGTPGWYVPDQNGHYRVLKTRIGAGDGR